MLSSLRKNSLDSLFKEVRVFKVIWKSKQKSDAECRMKFWRIGNVWKLEDPVVRTTSTRQRQDTIVTTSITDREKVSVNYYLQFLTCKS